MRKRLLTWLLITAMVLAMVPAVFADDYTFKDRKGVTVTVPENAWATSVVSFTPGDPWTKKEKQQDPKLALGAPDYKNSYGDLNLGAGGVLVLGFDVAIYDGEGDDIYVFEVGGNVEATQVEVSSDLVTWYNVGIAQGSTAGVDLNGKVPEGSRFRYVRLTDQKQYPSGSWPGADIDAVAGLNVKPASSNWAQSEMDRAEELDLVPAVLKNTDLTQPITRLEFAAVAVKVYEKLAGTEALPAVTNPFTDSSDLEVLKAYNLGITDGIEPTLFCPSWLLTREQAATMLTRTFKRATMPGWTLASDSQFKLVYDQPALFADDSSISAYAKDSVYFMAANGIIDGVGNNKFAPKNTTTTEEANRYANATREQALAIAVRMVEKLG